MEVQDISSYKIGYRFWTLNTLYGYVECQLIAVSPSGMITKGGLKTRDNYPTGSHL